MDRTFLRNLLLSKLAESRLYGQLYLQVVAATEARAADIEKTADLKKLLEELEDLHTAIALQLPELEKQLPREGIPPDPASAEMPLTLKAEGVEVTRQRLKGVAGLRSAGYNEARQVLDVEFSSGAVYRYYAVPPEVAEQLEAKGRQAMSFFSREIRNAYEFKQLR